MTFPFFAGRPRAGWLLEGRRLTGQEDTAGRISDSLHETAVGGAWVAYGERDLLDRASQSSRRTAAVGVPPWGTVRRTARNRLASRLTAKPAARSSPVSASANSTRGGLTRIVGPRLTGTTISVPSASRT